MGKISTGASDDLDKASKSRCVTHGSRTSKSDTGHQDGSRVPAARRGEGEDRERESS